MDYGDIAIPLSTRNGIVSDNARSRQLSLPSCSSSAQNPEGVDRWNLYRETPRELTICAPQPHITDRSTRMASRSRADPSVLIVHGTQVVLINRSADSSPQVRAGLLVTNVSRR